jgi:hypothetical protein
MNKRSKPEQLTLGLKAGQPKPVASLPPLGIEDIADSIPDCLYDGSPTIQFGCPRHRARSPN